MSSNEFRKWLAIGSGVSIEIGERDLDVTLVRVRPNGAAALGAFRIERYAERPAAEWGGEYARFLKQHGASHLAATVVLARRDVIVRQVAMPGVSDSDLPQAIGFQLDGLHPFAEDDAVFGWARMDGGANIMAGITRREVVDHYVELFSEAGIKVASFTFSAAAIYGSLRLFTTGPTAGFLAVVESDGEMEAYGESEARPLFSACFDTAPGPFAERARNQALSELRLPAETVVASVAQVMPQPRRAPEGFDLSQRGVGYAAAIVAACPRLGLHVNLLPPELRAGGSRLMFLPTIVLAVLLASGAGGLAAYSAYVDHVYLDKLHAEIARLEPDARKPMQVDRAIEAARARTAQLDQFKKRTHDDMEVIAELTRILEPPAWVTGLDISRDTVRFSGEAPQAAGLLKLVDKSPLFEGSEFSAPMSHTQIGDFLAIKTRREGRSK